MFKVYEMKGKRKCKSHRTYKRVRETQLDQQNEIGNRQRKTKLCKKKHPTKNKTN